MKHPEMCSEGKYPATFSPSFLIHYGVSSECCCDSNFHLLYKLCFKGAYIIKSLLSIRVDILKPLILLCIFLRRIEDGEN